MDARALFVGLLENRRHVDRTAEARPLAAVVAVDVAAILHDEFRAGRDPFGGIVVDERHALIARRDRRGQRAVKDVVVIVNVARIVAAECGGELVTRIEKIVGDHFAAAGVHVRRVEAVLRRAGVDRRRRAIRFGEVAAVPIEAGIEDGDDLPLSVDAVIEERCRVREPAGLDGAEGGLVAVDGEG